MSYVSQNGNGFSFWRGEIKTENNYSRPTVKMKYTIHHTYMYTSATWQREQFLFCSFKAIMMRMKKRLSTQEKKGGEADGEREVNTHYNIIHEFYASYVQRHSNTYQ